MTIRKQLLLITGIAIIMAIGLLYFTSRSTLLNNLLDIENTDIKRNVVQTQAVMNHMTKDVVVTNADWAVWDDTYQFIEDRDEDYINSNLGTETFVLLELNVMVYINAAGQVVFGKAVDLCSGEEIELPPKLLSIVQDSEQTPSKFTMDNPVSGFISLDEAPMYISSQPILKSDDSGPSRGTLIFGRYFDSKQVGKLSELIGYSTTVIDVKKIHLYPDYQAASKSISDEDPIAVQPLNNQYSAGYTFINGIDDKPILLMRVDIPRYIYQSGEFGVYLLVLLSLGVTLLIAVLAFLVLDRTVFRRFARLIKGIDNIRRTGDTESRLSVSGSDELAVVAGTVNGMLAALEQSFSQIKESEEKYRLIADNSTDVIFTSDLAQRFIYISPSIERLTGYSVEEIMSKTYTEILASGSINQARTALEEELKREEAEQVDLARIWTLQLESVRKDGSTCWVEVSITFLRDSNYQAIGFQGVARDITERRNQRLMIEGAAQEWRTTFDSISDLISLHDKNGKILRVNEAFAAAFNMKPQKAIGRNCYEIVHGLHEPLPDCPCIKSIESGTPVTVEFFEPKLGVYFEATCSPIFDETGQAYATIHILRDISERKEDEQRLKQLYAEEAEIRKKLEEEIDRRIKYTRALVHELKTPITPILVSSDILLEEIKSEALLRIARNINEGALNLNNRIDELLDLARIEIGTLELKPGPFEPKSLIQNIYRSMIVVAERNDQNLLLELPPFLSRVRGDKIRIQQTINNLLNNALKFTPEGGQITLRAKEERGDLIVEVQDTGPGLSKKDQQTLFEPYYRTERDRARLSGLGLGLSLSKRFVEMHGGQIWVKSQRGKGSTFGFSIPIKH